MKIFLLSIAFALTTICATAQNAGALLAEAVRLENLPDETAALHKYKEVLAVDPVNIAALAKCSELNCRIGTREATSAQRMKYYNIALGYAQRGLKLAPNDDRTNVSMAMVLGKSSLDKSGKEKLKSAREIKTLVEKAIKANSSNYLAWHILGRWNYEIGNLSLVERTAARVLYGSVPEGSNAKAIMYMEKARTLSPTFILNNLELAKAYIREGNKSRAKELLNGLQKFSISTEDDQAYKLEAAKLASGLS